MGIRGALAVFVVGMTFLTPVPASADPSAWATDNSGLTEVDPATYLAHPRAESREYAFLSPDGSLLCGMPAMQAPAVFCAPTSGQFPAALGMPAAVPSDPSAPPAQIRIVNSMNGVPNPSLTATNWLRTIWSALSTSQVRTLPANSSLSADTFTCWVRGQDEVHCAADRYVPSCQQTEHSSCWARDNQVGFAVSSTRYELFDGRR